MSHLILPIDLDGTLMCPTEVGGRGTKVAVTDIYPPTTPDYPLEFSLGLLCGSTAVFRLSILIRNINDHTAPISTGTTWSTTFDIHFQGVLTHLGVVVENASDPAEPVVNNWTFRTNGELGPCGAILTVDVREVNIDPGNDNASNSDYQMVFQPRWDSIT